MYNQSTTCIIYNYGATTTFDTSKYKVNIIATTPLLPPVYLIYVYIDDIYLI